MTTVECIDQITGNEKQSNANISINPPPRDLRCDVCGRHASEVKPFGGPGDPLRGDFTGVKLLKNFRNDFPVSNYLKINGIRIKTSQLQEDMKLGEEEFNKKYGANMYDEFGTYDSGCVSAFWECRDCYYLPTESTRNIQISNFYGHACYKYTIIFKEGKEIAYARNIEELKELIEDYDLTESVISIDNGVRINTPLVDYKHKIEYYIHTIKYKILRIKYKLKEYSIFRLTAPTGAK